MRSKKIHLAVSVTGNSVGDLGALSTVLFAREELLKQGFLVKVLCFDAKDGLLADVERCKPGFAAVVEGRAGQVDLEVYHQVRPDWDRYRQSYTAAAEIIRHTTRLRKMHNRYVQAGYTMQWMQNIDAPAVYVRLGVDGLDMDSFMAQGRALALGIRTEKKK